MWIKICANTNLSDALQAADLGADAIGFVFAPSKRRIDPAQAALISQRLPSHIERVGVFAGSSIEEIAAHVEQVKLNAVQLHGTSDPTQLAALRKLLPSHVDIIPTVIWQIGDDPSSATEVTRRLSLLPDDTRVLIDAGKGQVSGGLGISFNWDEARKSLQSFANLRIIIAGGLTPENVPEAIHLFQPYGVDVASGVEQTTGQKDSEKLQAFINNARAASTHTQHRSPVS